MFVITNTPTHATTKAIVSTNRGRKPTRVRLAVFPPTSTTTHVQAERPRSADPTNGAEPSAAGRAGPASEQNRPSVVMGPSQYNI